MTPKLLKAIQDLPAVPIEARREAGRRFVPSSGLDAWVTDHFIAEGGAFYNHDHDWLQYAKIGYLFAPIGNKMGGAEVIGTAQLGPPTGMPWLKGQREQQVADWFGEVPDFIITVDAEYFAEASAVHRMALLDHELYHCGIVRNKYGEPKLTKAGWPRWTMVPHDVEEFVGVIRRWGIDAGAGRARELVRAAMLPPEFGNAGPLNGVCGCCGKRIGV